MTNTQILTIPIPPSAQTIKYEGLPDEAATNLVADLHERAKVSCQPFQLEKLDRSRHPRGLCVGITRSSTPIAVFYVTENGVYAWAPTANLHVTSATVSQYLVSQPVQVGMIYWFRASESGHDHAKAEKVGTAGPLKAHYLAVHRPKPKPISKKIKSSDDETGESPVLRPATDESGFAPLKSLDELGL